MKYAELHYRLRALPKAETETRRAVDVARDPWELRLAQQQLAQIRRLIREGTQKPEWSKPLGGGALAFVVMTLLLCAAAWWAR